MTGDKPAPPGQPGHRPQQWDAYVDTEIDRCLPHLPHSMRDAMHVAAVHWAADRRQALGVNPGRHVRPQSLRVEDSDG